MGLVVGGFMVYRVVFLLCFLMGFVSLGILGIVGLVGMSSKGFEDRVVCLFVYL